MAPSIQDFQYVEREAAFWQKQTQDIQNIDEKPANARDIGLVNINDSRLNLITALHDGDTVDYYKFNVTSRGEMQLTYAINDGVNIEIYNDLNTKLGDNSEDAALEFTPIEIDDDESYTPGAIFVTLDPGTYYVKVTRDSDVAVTEHLNYQLQLQMGDTYGNAYEVVESRAPDASSVALQGQPVSSAPPAGASIATQLLGMVGGLLDALRR